MPSIQSLAFQVLKRDGTKCYSCGTTARPVLATHHVIPVELGGEDALGNLVALCANCHRSVHWLAAGDRSLHPNAYGLGPTLIARRKLVALARRIRTRRLKQVGTSGAMRHSIPLSTALTGVVSRNGLDQTEARLLQRCFLRAWRAIRSLDRRGCSLRVPRNQQFVSVIANSHLAVRVPAWTDDRYRDGDIFLIWPQATRPSIFSVREFRRLSDSRFRLIPYFNLSLTWEECLALNPADWRVFAEAVHQGLNLVRTQRRLSNVVPD